MTKRKLGLSAFSVTIALVAVGANLLLAQGAHSQTPVAYSYFQGLSETDLPNVQAKLTYMDLTDKPVWSVRVTAPDQTFNLNQFAPFKRAVSDYAGDGFELITCQVTTAELV